jgi:hypothetical protein
VNHKEEAPLASRLELTCGYSFVVSIKMKNVIFSSRLVITTLRSSQNERQLPSRLVITTLRSSQNGRQLPSRLVITTLRSSQNGRQLPSRLVTTTLRCSLRNGWATAK